MRYVQMARAPGRVRIILSRVLGGGLAAAAVRLIVFFLGQRDFFYLGIVGVVWLLVLAAAAWWGCTASFTKRAFTSAVSGRRSIPRWINRAFPWGKVPQCAHWGG